MLGEDAVLASFLWMLACVVLIAGLAYWFTKYVAGRGAFGTLTGKGQMEVLDRLSLGRDQSVVLARIGERYLLLGTGTAGITLLAELTAEEAASWRSAQAPEGNPGFKEALITMVKQKRRR